MKTNKPIMRSSSVEYPVVKNRRYILKGIVPIFVNGKLWSELDVAGQTGAEVMLTVLSMGLMGTTKEFGPVTKISLYKP